MVQKINAPVSVTFDSYPRRVIWKNHIYVVTRLGLHHIYYKGKVLYHVFSVATQTLFLRLVLNSYSLHWTLEEISDGLPD